MSLVKKVIDCFVNQVPFKAEVSSKQWSEIYKDLSVNNTSFRSSFFYYPYIWMSSDGGIAGGVSDTIPFDFYSLAQPLISENGEFDDDYYNAIVAAKERTMLERTKPSTNALNMWFSDALRALKNIQRLQGDELVIFGINQELNRRLENLIWIAVVVCNHNLLAKFAEGGTRELNRDNYWLVIADFELTDSIVVL